MSRHALHSIPAADTRVPGVWWTTTYFGTVALCEAVAHYRKLRKLGRHPRVARFSALELAHEVQSRTRVTH